MKKILLTKNDSPESAIKKVMSEPHPELVLVIPKGSAIRASLSNFHTLKKEAEQLGRTIIIESVDDEVLAFAKAANLEAVHPLFHGDRRNQTLTDIVTGSHGATASSGQDDEEYDEDEEKPKNHHKQNSHKATEKHSRRKISDDDDYDAEESTEGNAPVRLFSSAKDVADDERVDGGDVPASVKRKNFGRRDRPLFANGKKAFIIGAVIVAIGGAYIIADQKLSRASITVTTKQFSWTHGDQIIADVSFDKSKPKENTIPAELFFQKKNVTQLFPASISQDVSLKATGKITIYNKYSSQPQPLVASTRFMTSDGKIFRLNNRVTIPGAVIKDSAITPSSVEADVTADQAGASYNLSTETTLQVPGFKDSPKYAGFYGIIKNTSGGFTGKKLVPSEADIASAKEKTSALLKDSLQNIFLASTVRDFKIINGATNMTITKVTVNPLTDEAGNFSVFAEANIQAIGFREKDLQAALSQKAFEDARSQLISKEKQLTVSMFNYSNVSVDFNKKQLSMLVNTNATVKPLLDLVALKERVLGQGVDSVQAQLGAFPDIASAQVEVWPFWRLSIPKNTEKVEVLVK